MKNTESHTVESLLRKSLLTFAEKHGNEEVMEKMTGGNWEKHLISESDDAFSSHIDDSIHSSYLEDSYYASSTWDTPRFEEYIENTTISDIYSDKKDTLENLMVLSSKLNPDFFKLVKIIHSDRELLHLLTLTSDKTFRNGVFYMDDSNGELMIKDKNKEVTQLDMASALEHYRKNSEEFFLEIQIIFG